MSSVDGARPQGRTVNRVRRNLGSGAWCLLAAAFVLSAGCETKGGGPGAASSASPDAAAECTEHRARVQQARKLLNSVTENAPPPDAPLDVAAGNTEALGKAAKEVAADFAKASPKRSDIADSVAGVKMLAGLAGDRLEAYARTLKEFGGKIEKLQKLEAASNDLAQQIGPDAIISIGCTIPKPGTPVPPKDPCAGIFAQLMAINRPGMPLDFADAAKQARARADAFEGLAQAIEALPPSAAQKKAREDVAKKARDTAPAVRALAQALDEAGPGQERISKERQGAQESASRLSAELEAADKLCAPPGAASASASAKASAAPSVSAAPALPTHP